jgi:exopolysaccharide biosynthesis predicted pyruvyltransferase EpsI
LDVIKDFKRDFNFNDKYIFVYQLDINKVMNDFINEASNKFKYKIFKVDLSKPNFIENFLFGVNMSQAIVTDSFHGTVFSIIFNKPFISYINSNKGRLRFYSLQKTFVLNDRIVFPDKNSKPDINLLNIPLNINQDLLDSLRNFSINYLQKNLHIN